MNNLANLANQFSEINAELDLLRAEKKTQIQAQLTPGQQIEIEAIEAEFGEKEKFAEAKIKEVKEQIHALGRQMVEGGQEKQTFRFEGVNVSIGEPGVEYEVAVVDALVVRAMQIEAWMEQEIENQQWDVNVAEAKLVALLGEIQRLGKARKETKPTVRVAYRGMK